MKPLDFDELAKLINFSRTTSINLVPSKKGTGWALYNGVYKVHTSNTPFEVLYLQSSITKNDIDEAYKTAFKPQLTQVVYAPILDRPSHQHHHRTRFFPEAKAFWSTKDYLRSFVRDELETYLSKVPKTEPDYYIDPRIEIAQNRSRRIPNAVAMFLLDPDFDDMKSQGKLGVVLAEPGQGKTYMCDYLVHKVRQSKDNLVPLFIQSQQWRGLPVEDQSSLWKVLAHCLRSFESPVTWAEGHEGEFIKVSLRAGLFRIIFDGFDEYILRNRNQVNPLLTLEALDALASETGARIVITSRSSFWNTIFLESAGTVSNKFKNIYLFNILPFDPVHAKNYFEKRLQKHKDIEIALKVYESLRKSSQDFAGRGFVLSLVADLVERADGNSIEMCLEPRAALWLYRQMCVREKLRFDLPLEASQQIEALSEFAIESMSGTTPDSQLLRLCLQMQDEMLGSADLDLLIRKLEDHPIIKLNGEDHSHWRFRYDEIAVGLVAKKLLDVAPGSFQTLVKKLKLNEDQYADIAQTITEFVDDDTKAHQEFIEIKIKAYLKQATSDLDNPYFFLSGTKLVSSFVLTAVNRFAPKGGARKDRAEYLKKLAGNTKIEGLVLTNAIASFDFRGVVFEKCYFEGVTFANCEFDENTIFKECAFIGGFQPENSTNFGLAKLEKCRQDDIAAQWISIEQIHAGKRQYSETDLDNDIREMLSKFTYKGGVGFKSILEDNALKGRIGRSPKAQAILDALKKEKVFEVHEVSGGNEKGLHVAPKAEESVRFYLQNNAFTGPLKDAHNYLQKKFDLK